MGRELFVKVEGFQGIRIEVDDEGYIRTHQVAFFTLINELANTLNRKVITEEITQLEAKK